MITLETSLDFVLSDWITGISFLSVVLLEETTFDLKKAAGIINLGFFFHPF
jgi:hypothetical protein